MRLGILFLLIFGAGRVAISVSPAEAESVANRAQEILKSHCLKCHGESKQSGGLDLRNREATIRGGRRGAGITPGDSAVSRLIQVVSAGGEPHMPPGKKQLSEAEITVLSAWIDAMPAAKQSAGEAEIAAGQMAHASRGHDSATPSETAIPLGADPTSVINLWISSGHQKRGVRAAGICDDRTFVRRIYLDLIGRIPTLDEMESFVSDTDSLKRTRLVDRLIASDAYAERMAMAFDAMLLGRKEAKLATRRSSGWHAYLQKAFASDRSWHDVTLEILLARGSSKDRGHIWYLFEQNNKHQEIAESIARGFFGIDIACAQCHDHPVAPEIKQAHYWGLVGFYRRGKNGKGKRGIAVEESAIGGFDDYANALTGSTEQLELTFFRAGTVDEPRPADPAKQKDNETFYRDVDGEPREPKFSRREQFVSEIVTEHPLLARSMVNRIWAMLIGRGIVQPVEEMDSAHRPSHPQMLDWLARDFASDGYRVKRLVRSIVLSDVYQYHTTGDSVASEGSASSKPADFATGFVKPLSAEAWLASLAILLAADDGSVEKVGAQLRQHFPDVLPGTEQSNIKQTLMLSNQKTWNQIFEDAGARFVYDPAASGDLVARLFQKAFGRQPDEEELVGVSDYLLRRSDRPAEAIAQVLWALSTSAEFRFNH